MAANLLLYNNVTFITVGANKALYIRKKKHMHTIQLTTEAFKAKVFDYMNAKAWAYKGTKPAIIDFYADWCGPCKMVAPILEELAKEYADDIVIYKVNTEVEQELAAVFGIQSIPTFLFIPMEGKPMMQGGAFPKHIFKQIIQEKLLPTSAAK